MIYIKRKQFSVTVDFQGVSDITNGDIKRMFGYFLENNIWAEDYDIRDIKVATTLDSQEV